MIISVVQLGAVDYATALRLQQRLVELRKNDEIANVLLLLEHTPVITLGRNARRNNVLASDELLRQRGVELFECDRGGDVTYHGPGQLVGYPIFDLRSFLGPDGERKTLGAVEFVRRLEEALIRTCADYGVATERVKGMTGVWTELATTGLRSSGPATNDGARLPSSATDVARPPSAGMVQAKIAAIGVHISRGVTSHGFALNVTNEPLDYFGLIIPCGIAKPVTSIEQQLLSGVISSEDAPHSEPAGFAGEQHASESRELPSTPSLDDVAQSIARNFGRVFNSQIVWVDSLDALLGRSVDIPARAPEELRKIAGDEDNFWA
ncbi:MAG: lipoyl(octanoyl) transferase LipB [Terriglobales bacterium]